jgi:hypothetical protein
MRSITLSAALLCLACGCAPDSSGRKTHARNGSDAAVSVSADADETAAATPNAPATRNIPGGELPMRAGGGKSSNHPAHSTDQVPTAGTATAMDPSAFLGRWRITRALQPGWREVESKPAPGWVGSEVVFGAARVHAPSPLSCGNARYRFALLPVDGLFQGALASLHDAPDRARELGLDTKATPTLQLSCDSGVFDLHRDDHGRLLMMLDQVIYVLEREPAAAAAR